MYVDFRDMCRFQTLIFELNLNSLKVVKHVFSSNNGKLNSNISMRSQTNIQSEPLIQLTTRLVEASFVVAPSIVSELNKIFERGSKTLEVSPILVA